MSPDLGNFLFELGGAFFIWMNVWKLTKDQKIARVFWPVWIFYSAWGLWNLYYYPVLGQVLSFWAGTVLVAGNICWVILAIRFRKRGHNGNV